MSQNEVDLKDPHVTGRLVPPTRDTDLQKLQVTMSIASIYALAWNKCLNSRFA